jgi:PAS domain S-box-containing protein
MYFDHKKQPLHSHGVVMDITRQKRMQEKLQQSEVRFRKALQINTVGVLFFDLEGKFLDANDAFLNMTGYTRENLDKGELNSERVTLKEWMPRTLEAFQELKETDRLSPYEK